MWCLMAIYQGMLQGDTTTEHHEDADMRGHTLNTNENACMSIDLKAYARIPFDC